MYLISPTVSVLNNREQFLVSPCVILCVLVVARAGGRGWVEFRGRSIIIEHGHRVNVPDVLLLFETHNKGSAVVIS